MTRLALRSAASLVPRNFTPRRIAGCTLWLDGNDLSTLWQTEDTSTPVTADDQDLGRWADKSGAGRVLSQSTSAERGKWRNGQAAANGMGALVTPAAAGAGSDWLASAIALTSLFGASEAHGFVVFRSTTLGSSVQVLGDSLGLFFINSPTVTSLRVRLWNGTQAESEVTLSSGIAVNTFYIAEFRRTSTPALFFSVNGGTEETVASAGALSIATSVLNIPARQAGAKHAGWIGQVALFNRCLGTHERNRVGRWLASLYGQTWTDH